MWSSVAVLALPIALDPVRLGVSLLLVSRPRPAQNLLFYWLGCVLASVVLLVAPILVLHFTPAFSPFLHDVANPKTTISASVRYAEIVLGVLLLSVAGLLVAHAVARRRGRVRQGTATAFALPDDNWANPVARLLRRDGDSQDAEPSSGSAGRRLLTRAQSAWESGNLWVAFVIGFWAGPNPSLVVFALTAILTSGAAIGTQIAGAVTFIVATLAVVEIVLISNLVTPTKTRALLAVLHDWVRARRRQVLAAMLALVGLALTAQGMGAL